MLYLLLGVCAYAEQNKRVISFTGVGGDDDNDAAAAKYSTRQTKRITPPEVARKPTQVEFCYSTTTHCKFYLLIKTELMHTKQVDL